MDTATTDAATTADAEAGTVGADGIAATEEAIGEVAGSRAVEADFIMAGVFTGTANLSPDSDNQRWG